jgi:hypothetical protein
MGGFTPAAVLTAIDTGVKIFQQRRQARAERARVEADAAADAAELESNRAEAARERDLRLRRALAAHRARFAAGGLDPAQGSAAAVLQGLAAEAEREDARDRERTGFRLGDLDRRRRRRLDLLAGEQRRAALDLFRRGGPIRSLLDI